MSNEEKVQVNIKNTIDIKQIIEKVLLFLQIFMTKTLAKRLVSIILIVIGVSNDRITELTGLCDRSVRALRKSLETGEIDSLFHVGGGGRKSKLVDVESAVINEINNNNFHTLQQIADMIYEKYGIKVSTSAVSRLLKKNKIRRLKCGSLPAKADPEKQRIFYDAFLHPLMNQAKEGTVTLLFMDASHFVLGCDFLGYIYGITRRFVKTFSGRMRYNVLGALNFISKKMTIVTNDTYITATEICELLKKVALEYAGKPIYIILDNARYQKCKIVEELAIQLGINLVYIPPYSPNLNLIERLWKHVKGKLRTKYYDKFEVFKENIDSIVNDTDKKDKAIIDKLIGEKVQLFDEPIIIDQTTVCYFESTTVDQNVSCCIEQTSLAA